MKNIDEIPVPAWVPSQFAECYRLEVAKVELSRDGAFVRSRLAQLDEAEAELDKRREALMVQQSAPSMLADAIPAGGQS